MRRGLLAKGFRWIRGMRISGILPRWQTNAHASADCGMHMPLKGSAQRLLSVVSSVIPKHVSSRWFGAQKNTLWCLWHAARQLVRPQDAAGPRSVVWRYAGICGTRHPARRVSALWQGEARAAGVSGRQSVLYQTLRLVRGSALCHGVGQGGCRGAAA